MPRLASKQPTGSIHARLNQALPPAVQTDSRLLLFFHLVELPSGAHPYLGRERGRTPL
jgi:hypothetical protein